MNTSDTTIALQQLLTEYELTQGESCPRCGYNIYQHRLSSPSCVRCLPPRGFHVYSDRLFAIRPWKGHIIRDL